MNRLKFFVLVFAVVALATSSAIAQPPGNRGGQRPQGPPPHEQNNVDPGRAVLQALDTDGNHEISAEEIANAVAALKTLDTNGDGKLSDDDLQGATADGARNQRGQGAANRGQGRRGQGRRGEGQGEREAGGRQGRGGPPQGAGGPPSREQFVSQAMEFDADKDGKLDAEELRKFAEQIGPPSHGSDRGQREGDNDRGRPQRPSRPDR